MKYTFCLTPTYVKTETHSNKFRRRQHVTKRDTTSNSEQIQTLKIQATIQIFISYNKMSACNSHTMYKCHKCRPHTNWTEFTALYHLWCTLHPSPLYTLLSCQTSGIICWFNTTFYITSAAARQTGHQKFGTVFISVELELGEQWDFLGSWQVY
jgi:hypothetical protein